jgi:hypothetical protein
MILNFLQIYNNYLSILERHSLQLRESAGFEIGQIREIFKYLKDSEDQFSYSFSNVNFIIDKKFLPSHSIPKNFNYVQVVLSIREEIVINKLKNNTIKDPLGRFEKFNIILFCDKRHYTSSWHLDRHVAGYGDGTTLNLHPMYHFSFGGYHMEAFQDGTFDEFGRSLILRTPRIMHPPMELVLGIDFIFNHFIPKTKLELLEDTGYLALIKKLKAYFWMPYSLAIAKNFCDRISIDNNSLDFEDSFVNGVLG